MPLTRAREGERRLHTFLHIVFWVNGGDNQIIMDTSQARLSLSHTRSYSHTSGVIGLGDGVDIEVSCEHPRHARCGGGCE